MTMIEADIEYAKGLGASSEVIEWCNTVLKAQCKREPPTVEEREHVLDYLISADAPTRLRKMSYAQAKEAARKWSEAGQKRGRNILEVQGDTEIYMDLGDDTVIVKLLTKAAYEREGALMRHCLGNYAPGSSAVYSLRDKKNEPHVTFEITKNGDSVQQIKGKGNGSIHPRYIEPTLAFLKSMGIAVRPAEMKNLGYYHVTDAGKKVFERFVDSAGNGPAYSHIGKESYIFARRS